MNTFIVESMGDCSSAIYTKKGKKFKLIAIVNPGDDDHPWPKTATQDEVMRWGHNCECHKVKLI